MEPGVSDDTLRGDVAELDKRGLLTKVHGGVCSVHPQQGLTGPDREEAMLKRIMQERAHKRIVSADRHRLNRAEAHSIASLGDIDFLVTENSVVEDLKTHWPKGPYTIRQGHLQSRGLARNRTMRHPT